MMFRIVLVLSLLTSMASAAAFAGVPAGTALDREKLIVDFSSVLAEKSALKSCESFLVDSQGFRCFKNVCVEMDDGVTECDGSPRGCYFRAPRCVRFESQVDQANSFGFDNVASACVKYGIFNHKVKLSLKNGLQAKIKLDKRCQADEAATLLREISALDLTSMLKCE